MAQIPFMLLLEAFFKFSTIGILLTLSLLIIKSKQRNLTTTLALLLFASFSSFLITTGSEPLRLTGPIVVPLRLFDSVSLLCVWLLGLSLFDDNFSMEHQYWAVGCVYLFIMIFVKLYYTGIHTSWMPSINITGIAVAVMGFVMMMHLAWVALSGHDEDLIADRRTARVTLSISLVIIITASILSEQAALYFGWNPNIYPSLYINYIFIMPVSLGAALWILRFDHTALEFNQVTQDKTDKLDAKDQIIYEKLINMMHNEHRFTEHGLTIGTLAQQLGLPAHQLRTLINSALGYSNFSSFLNHYRIEHVKHALSNPELARTPILTIALDAGFSSLAPFNRAFKATLGMTPTQFRSNILNKMTNKTD